MLPGTPGQGHNLPYLAQVLELPVFPSYAAQGAGADGQSYSTAAAKGANP